MERPPSSKSLPRPLTSNTLSASHDAPQGEETSFRVTFEPGEKSNPQNFHPAYKIWLTAQMSLLALAGALGSSILSSANTEIAEYTGVESEVTSLTVALFVLGWAFGPLLWAPISEVYGRRIGMLPPFVVMGCFSIGTAVSRNAASILITRFLGGIFASAPISNVPAALGDMWSPEARGIAMAFVSICISGGPTLGPIIGAAVVIRPDMGWRWTAYMEAIIVFSLTLLSFFCLPETFAPVLLKQKAQKLRKTTGDQRYWHPHEKEEINASNVMTKYFGRPLRMLVTEPLVTCTALYASFTYSLIYLTLEIFPIVFREQRHWSLMSSSLTFLGILIGVILAAPLNFLFQPYYKRAVKLNHGKAVAEARLPPLIVGGFLLTTGLFWFAWTAAPKYPWPSPVVAAGFIGAGFTLVFQQCLNFLVDTYGPYAASAVSANTILRSVLACALPVAAAPMAHNLGIGPAISILGGVSCLALPVPFLFMKYTPSLRKKSKFAVVDSH
ncbi:Major facilitator superfamily domain, general substrate transporter [Penicillium italicum]|uniref:Major facilitator superfamily domain, general substrate transporter n=1 Tax=Penicillium italicum TaxID=40296 RepID=A0A0A2LA88_PENIT|nr:Major facilitator superfamily domain, general substrate transporter [Penicillium italicum]